MFTLKVFQPDGSYEAIACNTFTVAPDPKRVNVTDLSGKSHRIKVDVGKRIIVENASGQTIDVIRP